PRAPTGPGATTPPRWSPGASPRFGPDRAGLKKRRPAGLRSVGGMGIKVSHCFITVDDQDKALAFYRDALGLVVSTAAPLGPYRWLTVTAPGQPDVEIVLATPDMGHGPEDTEALKALLAKGALQGVIFTTGDFDATFERVRATGAEVLQEPIDQPYGVRDCGFRDPSGNEVRIGTPLSQPSCPARRHLDECGG